MKTKHEVLLENGYEAMVGYCFQVPPVNPEEYERTFIEKDEVDSIVKLGAETFYCETDGDGQIFELHQAWERLYDMYYDSEAETMDFVEWEKKMLE